MVQRAKARPAVKSIPLTVVEHPIPPEPYWPCAIFKVERVGRNFMGYKFEQTDPMFPGVWKPVFPAPTLLSSVLGALETEMSNAAVRL